METWCQSPDSPKTAPARSQLAGYLLTLTHTHYQAHTQLFTARRATDTHAHSQGAGLCPSSQPQASPPRGSGTRTTTQVSCAAQHPPLPHQRSFLPSTKHRLQHLMTSLAAFHTPSTMRRYQQTWGQGAGTTGTLLTHPRARHCCRLTQSPLQGRDNRPRDSHHLHRAAEGSSLPTGPASWCGLRRGVVLHPGPAGTGRTAAHMQVPSREKGEGCCSLPAPLPSRSPRRKNMETASDVLQERDGRRAQTQGGDIFNYGTGNPSADRW